MYRGVKTTKSVSTEHLDFEELINIIETVTPYYYEIEFKEKIQKLIKEAEQFNNDDQKIVYS